MNSIRLSIEGLEFSETQDKVRNQLKDMIGVTEVSLSEGQDYMDIQYDGQVSVSEINNHLQNNGYKVTNIS